MDILQPISIFSQAESLVVDDDGEFWGGAEPYLWAFHWKVDGESLSIGIEVNITSTNLNTFSILTVAPDPDYTPFVFSPQGSHGNINPVNDNDDNANNVPIPRNVGRFDGELIPIPITIDFIIPQSIQDQFALYFPNGMDEAVLLDAIDNGISTLAGVLNFIDSNFFDIDIDTLSQMLSHPEINTCPPISLRDAESMLEHFTAEFIISETGGMPGVFGSVFILMEEDGFTESHAERVRQGFQAWLTETLAGIVGSISLENLIPNVEPYEGAIKSDAILNFGMNLFAPLLQDIDSAWTVATTEQEPTYGGGWADIPQILDRITILENGVAAIFGIIDPDDILLVHTVELSHADFLNGEKTFEENENIRIILNHGSWTLRGRLGLQ